VTIACSRVRNYKKWRPPLKNPQLWSFEEIERTGGSCMVGEKKYVLKEDVGGFDEVDA
jgi:hypothetical protein